MGSSYKYSYTPFIFSTSTPSLRLALLSIRARPTLLTRLRLDLPITPTRGAFARPERAQRVRRRVGLGEPLGHLHDVRNETVDELRGVANS